ncbi:MAG TPA: DMT family transporter [Ktedonobacteraceae bacterium]|nr:DMT family transporter [Ktedonobacteraceae bacterium]
MPATSTQPATIQRQQHAKGIAGLAPLGASCLWGGMYVVSKASFDAIPPITLGLFRLLIGGLALWVTLWLSRRLQAQPTQKLTSSERKRLPLLGLCIAATIITQFTGTNLATAHDGALLTTITPVFIVPIAWLLLRERPHWRTIVGMLIALIGVVLIVGIGEQSLTNGQALLGDALLIASALAWALFTVLGAPLVRSLSALSVATYATIWSLIFFVPLAAWELIQHPLTTFSFSSLASILYLGIGATALAWFLWYKGVERLPASVSAIFFFAQPLVGGLLSALFLHESLGLSFWLGGLVLAVGILLAG